MVIGGGAVTHFVSKASYMQSSNRGGKSGTRAAWELSRAGESLYGGCQGEQLDAVNFGILYLLRRVGIAVPD